ncbi:aminotransferase class I/II-fold pyridoxal phosphate-dependent enzyme [Legionella fallonii]|uniref:Putative Histidinol-phosphate transaminase n=1 Tax=Legionella fallonii LLAP-10 TaxID=1212491 RepID=A0A098G0W8_9GAMM|nr:pyridoxal phosphate-dependent aminotransferase [Legionella fallonii]CEG55611.1 putative Histidinol-phosphate transaminase [Legionella fallonii LLAP-10]
MLTPDGLSADDTDKVMLLNMWAKTLEKENHNPNKSFIYAGMGKPTFRVNIYIVEMLVAYWQAILALIQKEMTKPGSVKESIAIDYGDGRGDIEPRAMMATAMSSWYASPITADNILFTTGGAGALRVIFETFNKLYADSSKYRVITPFPHYSLYADNDKHILHPIDVMQEPGYRLTATALDESILSAYELAKQDGCPPRAVLLCNPSNPLGTVITEEEWKDIAQVLRKYPHLKLVIDEAYAEMYWSAGNIPSVLKYAPELKDRVVLLRSATKALSSAGERFAMLMAFDPELMNALRNKNISTIGHAARSAQLAYAHAMAHFGDKEKKELKDFYYPKVQYVWQRAQAMGAAMPDPSYKIDSTFYVLCDFSDLLGDEIPTEAQRALGRTGRIKTSEELIYSLLFKESLMLAAGSFFGMPENNGVVRITCSGTEAELKDMMDRLEGCLLQARKRKSDLLVKEIRQQITILTSVDAAKGTIALKRLEKISVPNNSVLQLKAKNKVLVELLDDIKQTIKNHKTNPASVKAETRANAALALQSFIRTYTQSTVPASQAPAVPTTHPSISTTATKTPPAKQPVDLLQKEWEKFVDVTFSEGALKTQFLNLKEADKETIQPWIEHKRKFLEKMSPERTMVHDQEKVIDTPKARPKIS